VSHFTLAATAIAIAVSSVKKAARWNYRRPSAEIPKLETAGVK
jgi:hypothetical protein